MCHTLFLQAFGLLCASILSLDGSGAQRFFFNRRTRGISAQLDFASTSALGQTRVIRRGGIASLQAMRKVGENRPPPLKKAQKPAELRQDIGSL